MPVTIRTPSIVKAAGVKKKIIREIFGRVNSVDSSVSIAHMSSPNGWEEPGQCPEFDEYTYVLSGTLKVETTGDKLIIGEGEAIHTRKGEWVRYSTPFLGGADYIAICLPAFSPDTVHRDE
jgi:mannose-6-phosphate isomerase-like protein (cupin superfamily)